MITLKQDRTSQSNFVRCYRVGPGLFIDDWFPMYRPRYRYRSDCSKSCKFSSESIMIHLLFLVHHHAYIAADAHLCSCYAKDKNDKA